MQIMDRKKITAVAALPGLTLMMIMVFQGTKQILGTELAWHAGFWIYWPVWCVLYPWRMLGWRKMGALLQRRKLRTSGWILMAFPPVMSFIGSLIFQQDRRCISGIIVYILMSFANGILEEMLWRGVYITLFPDNKLWGLAWPAVWFALWHLAPGSISPLTGVWMLMAGALVFGACWGLLAMKTESILWSVISHTLSGLLWVLR
jgi:membrane protease YdiL (CAAX protease family)